MNLKFAKIGPFHSSPVQINNRFKNVRDEFHLPIQFRSCFNSTIVQRFCRFNSSSLHLCIAPDNLSLIDFDVGMCLWWLIYWKELDFVTLS